MTGRTGRRSIVRLAVAALAVSVVPGCGTGGGGPETQNGENAVLKVWFPGDSPDEIKLVTKELVPEFERKNNAKVEVTYVDWSQIDPKLSAALAGNIAPDVFGHGPAAAAGFAAQGRIAELDGYVSKLPEKDRADMGKYLEGGQVNGRQFMVPLFGQGLLVAYRKDMFAQAGATPPTSWTEAQQAAAKLTVRSGSRIDRPGIQLPSAAVQRQQSFAGLLASEGGSLMSDDGKELTFNSEAGVRALEYFAGLYGGPDAVSNRLGADLGAVPPAQHPLATGKTAMAGMFSNQLIGILRARPDLADKIAVLPPLKGSVDAQGLRRPRAGAVHQQRLGQQGPRLEVHRVHDLR